MRRRCRLPWAPHLRFSPTASVGTSISAAQACISTRLARGVWLQWIWLVSRLRPATLPLYVDSPSIHIVLPGLNSNSDAVRLTRHSSSASTWCWVRKTLSCWATWTSCRPMAAPSALTSGPTAMLEVKACWQSSSSRWPTPWTMAMSYARLCDPRRQIMTDAHRSSHSRVLRRRRRLFVMLTEKQGWVSNSRDTLRLMVRATAFAAHWPWRMVRWHGSCRSAGTGTVRGRQKQSTPWHDHSRVESISSGC